MHYLRGVFIFIAASLTIAGNSQTYIISDDYLKIYDAVLRFDKEKALKGIYSLKTTSSENLLAYDAEAMLFFIEAFLSETQVARRNWNNRFAEWEAKLKTGNKKSPFYNYCLARLYLEKGLLDVKFQDYFQAGLFIRKAARMLDNNFEKFPNFYFQYKEQGILHCFIGNIPDQFQWLTGLVGLTGDLKGGEKKLKTLLDLSVSRKEFKFLQLETFLYYTFLHTVLLNDDKKIALLIPYLEKVRIDYSGYPLLIFLSSNIYSHLGMNDKAIKEISFYQLSPSSIPFYYLYYMHGVLLLQKGHPDAKRYFMRFLNEFKGMHYVKSAYHKLAWCWLLEGNEAQYELYMTMVLNSGMAVADADKQALSEAKSARKPHPQLLKARLLSDGGYYQQAIETIRFIDSSNICQKHDYCVEYFYRFARIYHLTEKINEAIRLYQLVIEMGSNDKTYFAANSALMLGTIYESRNDFSNARIYYRKCFEMPFEEYRNSIQQKAKAGLQRIG